MRHLLRTAIAIAAVLVASCVPSVYPLYTSKDLEFDPALVGEWMEDGQPDESWTFAKADATSYRLVIKDGQKSAPFSAHLVRLGAYRFLDLQPHEDGLPDDTILDVYRMSLIAGHLFVKVSQIEPTLQMAFLDPEWLEKRLAARPSELAHITRGNKDIVLTAATPDLQRFMRQHAENKDAFGDTSAMKKKR